MSTRTAGPARLILAGLLIAAAAAVATCGGARRPATHTVVIVDATRYAPATLTLEAGDTVVWVNKDIMPHTATSEAAGFDSGRIDPGQSWSYTVTKAGSFEYICTYHPTMKGRLLVN